MLTKRNTLRVNLLLALILALGLLALTACDDSEEIITPAPTILSATEELPAATESAPADTSETVAPAEGETAYPVTATTTADASSTTSGEMVYPGADGTPVDTPYPIN